MKVTFIGTASCFPTPTRGVSCTALQFESGNVWLFDCGEGSQIQIQKSSLRMARITKIFITHLHGDHLFGLPGLLCTLGSQMSETDRCSKVVDIYGPVGIRKFITISLALARSPLPFKYRINELIPDPDQYPPNWNEWKVDHESIDVENLMEASAVKISSETDASTGQRTWRLFDKSDDPSGHTVVAGAIFHRIPSFGYVIQEPDLPGTLDVEKATRAGLKPGPQLGQLKRGLDVVLENGSVVKPIHVLGPTIKGRKVSILGDTHDSHEMISLAMESDLVIHEATMENSLKEQAIEYGHSTPEMAANFALESKAKRLCINHLSPRYRPISSIKSEEEVQKPKESDKSAEILLNEAVEAIKTRRGACDVTIAEDFMELNVPREKPAPNSSSSSSSL